METLLRNLVISFFILSTTISILVTASPVTGKEETTIVPIAREILEEETKLTTEVAEGDLTIFSDDSTAGYDVPVKENLIQERCLDKFKSNLKAEEATTYEPASTS